MTAPVLVALARADRDPRTAAAVTDLVEQVRLQRPDLRVEKAWIGSGSSRHRPTFDAVLDKLARNGVEEVVVVPLALTDDAAVVVDLGYALARTERPLAVRVAAPLGLETALLEVLDIRMREALSTARVRELDALVLAASGSADPLTNQTVARLARVWGNHHKLPVTAAYASSAPPATGEAVRAFRAEGRRHIAVASLFLTHGELCDRATELALEAGAIAVSAPLGAHPEIARMLLARYAVGAVELVPV
ncbi:MAG: cobalamin biosynthesis protein CbiX [Nocardioides sp.]|nr:cobalamin biosynthesis protein CbiX [Nocardioides sp.]